MRIHPNPLYRKAGVLLLGTLLAYGLLVATHVGEFWPFSIYPMFSQAGQPWSRTVVREVEPAGAVTWRPVATAGLPGRAFAAAPHGVDQTDLANFVSKTQRWDADRVAALKRLFAGSLGEGPLLVMRAGGEIVDGDSVRLTFTPYVLLAEDSVRLNPSLPR